MGDSGCARYYLKRLALIPAAQIISVACYLDESRYEIGVCCDAPQNQKPTPITPREFCPFGLVCLPDVHGQGEVIGKTKICVPFTPGGFFAPCNLGDEFSSPGVCCTNPLTTPPPVTTTTSASVYIDSSLPTINQCGILQNSVPVIPAQRNQSNPCWICPCVAYNEAQFGEFPWQAIIFFINYTFKCNAYFIGNRWLLTPPRCSKSCTRPCGFDANDFSIRVGEWQVNSFDEPLPYVDASVAAITVHPNFNSRNVHNDIAVIELVEPLSPQYHINSICLPAQGQIFWDQRCIATGWGKDSFTGQYQTVMKKIELPLVDHHQCQNLLRKTRLGRYFNLDDSFICAGGEENEDACKGDGGGPLACQDPITGSYVLTGITAWGISCGEKDVPGVYADVQAFVPWVEAVLSGTYNANSFNNHSTQN
ncbi:unnamed protein product, partial [Meganyctiphanes norvegica]